MRNDFEKLIWLYLMGVEQVVARQPTNYFEVKIVKKINEAADQDISSFKKTEEVKRTERKKSNYEDFRKEFNQINNIKALDKYWRNNLINKFKGLEILGPATCFKEKIKNNYRYQLILKSLKKYDSNGEKLHLFINDNFIKYKNSKVGSNKINIHVDPISMI